MLTLHINVMQLSQNKCKDKNTSSCLIHEYETKIKFHASGVIRWKKLMNNLSKATELTIWTVSILHSSALTESFPSSFYHLPLYVLKLASLSLAWHGILWRSGFCWWRKSWHYFQGLWFLCLILSLCLLLFSQTCSQKPVLSWNGRALQIPPFGLGENWLGAVRRGWCRGPSPVARPARIHKSFQWTRWCQDGWG